MEQHANKRVFLIHGFEGTPNGGWRPYVMRELEKHDIYTCALPMPTPSKPILVEWLDEIRQYVEKNSGDDIYLIGHSLGGTTILRFLEQYNFPHIKGVVIVSAPCHQGKNEKIANFLHQDFDWSLIKSKIQNVVVIHGDNDPNVPVADAEEIANELNAKLILIPNGKHLNGSAGFTELPQVIECLLEMI